ncbi:hypothetical protein [Paraburkholderia bannensis]|uniref:hypothetical protein n=1 Tax=Paraburkholderia bannensis TaxID=765414 RepID=UPI002AB7AD14|nr:hypothetical protein [Paraburkholderia bannensis]
MTAQFLKRAAVCLSVFVVVWIAAIAWWSSTRQIPGTAHAIGILFALPVAIICGSILALRARAGSPTSGTPGAAAPRDSANEAANSPKAAQLRATITHVAMRTAQGNSPDAIDVALTQGARAELDPMLADSNGFPVRAARVATLDDAELDVLQERWRATWRDLPLAGDRLRAIALLEEVVLDTADALGHVALVAPLPGVQSRVQFDVVVDPNWDNALCTALSKHLQARVAQQNPHLSIGIKPVRGHTAASAFAQLDLAIMALGHAPQEDRTTETARWYVVAATHSSLDEATIADALRSGRLFTPSNQHGEIAGESATAIVLGTETQHAAASATTTGEAADDAANEAQQDNQPIAILARPALKSRDEPDPQAAKEASGLLEATTHRAIELADIPADSIGGIVADRGAQPTHAVELALFAGARFPKLEPLVDTVALDGGCGATRAAGALLAVALAAHRARTKNHPVLCTTLGDPAAQSAIVVLPAIPA